MNRERGRGADVAQRPGLDRARLNDLLETTVLGRTLTYQSVCSSTNDLALRSNFEHGHLVIADHQTKGRGRQDREWIAPAGTSLLASLVISWQGTTTRGSEITFVAAIAVCSALRALGIARSHIKWPNDILVGERKICGILSESRSRDGVLGPVVVGIGVNLSQTAGELPVGATSARVEIGSALDREAVLAEVLNRFEAELSALRTAGFAVTRSRCWRRLVRAMTTTTRSRPPGGCDRPKRTGPPLTRQPAL